MTPEDRAREAVEAHRLAFHETKQEMADALTEIIREAEAEKREACAKVAEKWCASAPLHACTHQLAAAIRAQT